MTEKRGSVKVSGSEYSPGEDAFIYAQILDAIGDPANGSTVTLNVFKSDGSKYVNSGNMVYVAGSNGVYKYSFTAPTSLQRMIADVAATDPIAYGTEGICVSELANNITSIKKIESGRWRILNNQMIFYEENNEDILMSFDLKDSNGNLSEINIVGRVPAA